MNSDFSDFIRFFPIFRLFPTFRLLDSTTLIGTQVYLGPIKTWQCFQSDSSQWSNTPRRTRRKGLMPGGQWRASRCSGKNNLSAWLLIFHFFTLLLMRCDFSMMTANTGYGGLPVGAWVALICRDSLIFPQKFSFFAILSQSIISSFKSVFLDNFVQSSYSGICQRFLNTLSMLQYAISPLNPSFKSTVCILRCSD